MIDQGHKGSQWLGWKLSFGHWSKVDKQKGKGKGGGGPKKLWLLMVKKHWDSWGLLQTAWEPAFCQKYQLKILAFLFHCKEICGRDLVSKPQQKIRQKNKTSPKFMWQEKY